MNTYTLSVPEPATHVVHISYEVDGLVAGQTVLYLPLWRPGRYQLQDYPKNLLSLQVTNSMEEPVTYLKTAKGSWVLDTPADGYLKVDYRYYANQPDAGASYVDDNQIYINPCNCFIYADSEIGKPCRLQLNIPPDYRVAISLPQEHECFMARDYHHMADSPFIASSSIQHGEFRLADAIVHVWVQGDFEFDMDELLELTKRFCQRQLEMFGGLPLFEYHFMYQMLPWEFHHGVEHCDNTVIALGPDKNFERKAFYNEWMSVSCHEFFHLWNVKRIRPADMLPYRYQAENYSTLGWVYEGVTTYYGDLICLRSRVSDFDAWAAVFNRHLTRHYHNAGRYNMSVAASSFDTWLDGYQAGVPNRKVNIYTEGMLAALILDAHMRELTSNRYSLDDLMKQLNNEFGDTQKGYVEKDYQRIAENLCGQSLQWYFDEVINGCGYIEKYLPHALQFLGLELVVTPNADDSARRFGLQNNLAGLEVWPGSPANKAGVDANYKLLSIDDNGVAELEHYGFKKQVLLIADGKDYFSTYRVKLSGQNQHNFDCWAT